MGGRGVKAEMIDTHIDFPQKRQAALRCCFGYIFFTLLKNFAIDFRGAGFGPAGALKIETN